MAAIVSVLQGQVGCTAVKILHLLAWVKLDAGIMLLLMCSALQHELKSGMSRKR